jgi:hypothetical protein
MSAKEPFAASVDLKVLVQVSFLCEGKFAALIVADVWPFFGMNSQVVIEIVPFAEDFSTI